MRCGCGLSWKNYNVAGAQKDDRASPHPKVRRAETLMPVISRLERGDSDARVSTARRIADAIEAGIAPKRRRGRATAQPTRKKRDVRGRATASAYSMGLTKRSALAHTQHGKRKKVDRDSRVRGIDHGALILR